VSAKNSRKFSSATDARERNVLISNIKLPTKIKNQNYKTKSERERGERIYPEAGLLESVIFSKGQGGVIQAMNQLDPKLGVADVAVLKQADEVIKSIKIVTDGTQLRER
jgi:hypothetical protein